MASPAPSSGVDSDDGFQRTQTEGADNSGRDRAEWEDTCLSVIAEAQATRSRCNAAREETNEVKHRIDASNNEKSKLVNEQLKRKIHDTASLKGQLEKRLNALSTESDALTKLRQVLKKHLSEREQPMKVAEHRARLRSQKPTREQIYDSAERAVEAEYKDLRSSVDQLNVALEQVEAHLERMEHLDRLVQLDIEDKAVSLQLDQDCLDLVINPSKPLQLGGTVPKLETLSSPQRSTGLSDQWQKATEELLEDGLKMEQTAIRMKKNIKKLLAKAREQNVQSNSNGNLALRKKLNQTAKLQATLSQHIQTMNEEIDQLDSCREQLSAAKRHLEGPLGVVQRRLAWRLERPGDECVRDGAEEAMEGELMTLNDSLEKIQEKIEQVDREKAKISQAKAELEDDLQDKTASAKLDTTCLEMGTSGLLASKESPFEQAARMAAMNTAANGPLQSSTTSSQMFTPKAPGGSKNGSSLRGSNQSPRTRMLA